MRILLVEDDLMLGDAVRAWLVQEDYAVDWMTRGDLAAHSLRIDEFDVIVLDIGLPGCSGFDVLRQARADNVHTPVLILTARDAIEDRVTGLDLGADDYLLKPFDMMELSARLRAIYRRSVGRSTPQLSHADITLDPASMSVTKGGRPLSLTSSEYTILHWLMENRNRVATRSKLYETLYGYDSADIGSNTTEVHISHLRRKIGPDIIQTIRGVGYMIKSQ